MSTALDLITDALRELGVVGAGQVAAADDADLGLRYLNRLVQDWSNTKLMMPVVTQVSVNLTGQQSYTIGPSGADVTAARPIKVVNAYSELSSQRYHCDVITREQWTALANLSDGGSVPNRVYYQRSNPGRIWVHPVVSGGPVLKLDCLSLITSFSLSGNVTLPEGYETALVLSLAERLAGSFGRAVSADLKSSARGARAVVKRTNAEPLYLEIDREEDFDIQRGY